VRVHNGTQSSNALDFTFAAAADRDVEDDDMTMKGKQSWQRPSKR
jgi:hypothetical protein